MGIRTSKPKARRRVRAAQVTLAAAMLLWSGDALANQSVINAITQACSGQTMTVNVNDCATCHGSSFTTINPSNMYFSDAQSGFYDSFCTAANTGSTGGTGTGSGTGTGAGGTDTGTGTGSDTGTSAGGTDTGSTSDDGTMAGDDSGDMYDDDGPSIGGLGDDGTDGGYGGHRGRHGSGGGDTSGDGSTDVAGGNAGSAPTGKAWGRSDGWSDSRRHQR